MGSHTYLIWMVVLVLWAAWSIYLARKRSWFGLVRTMEAFPFNARQFFVVGATLCFSFGIILAAFALSKTISGALQQRPLHDLFATYTTADWRVVENIVAFWLAMGGFALLISLLPTDLVSIVRGKSSSLKKLGKGAYVGLMVFPIIVLVQMVVAFFVEYLFHGHRSGQVALLQLSSVEPTKMIFYFFIFTVICVVPYVEEILFRGVIQGFFGGLLHPVLAISLTAALFAGYHLAPIQHASNYEIFIAISLFSFFASMLRLKEDSIAASIGMHAAYNCASLVVFFFYANKGVV